MKGWDVESAPLASPLYICTSDLFDFSRLFSHHVNTTSVQRERSVLVIAVVRVWALEHVKGRSLSVGNINAVSYLITPL